LREQKIFEEERRQIGSPREPRFAVNGERLLADGSLARMPKLGNLLVTKALELEQRDLALRLSQAPALELPIDRFAKPQEYGAELRGSSAARPRSTA
jgi:hypothetical protein